MNKEDKITFTDKRLLVGKVIRARDCDPHETHSKAGYYEVYCLQRRIIYRWDANMTFVKTIIEKLKRGEKENLYCLCHGVDYTLL